jgi:hypothetical protein
MTDPEGLSNNQAPKFTLLALRPIIFQRDPNQCAPT